jgi:hypothetical protein
MSRQVNMTIEELENYAGSYLGKDEKVEYAKFEDFNGNEKFCVYTSLGYVHYFDWDTDTYLGGGDA